MASTASDEESHVPCGECKVCCMSRYFVYIHPDEIEALAVIPRKLLLPAFGWPKGVTILMHDKNGKCPMLLDNGCSIYGSRPQACRKYDCRIFTATGITAGDGKSQVCLKTERWQFSYPTMKDLSEHSAVRDSARFLKESSASLPYGFAPADSIGQAILALKTYKALLYLPVKAGVHKKASSIFETAKAIMTEHAEFCLKKT